MRALLALLLLLPALRAQNATSLALQQDFAVTLQPERTYFFEVQLPGELPASSEFFFLAQWPSDPLQNPFIDIYAGQGTFWSCYNSNDEFSGVCSIPADRLTPNSSLTAEVYCFVECRLLLRPFLSPVLRLALNDTTTFAATPGDPLLLEIEMQVPPSLNFTQLALYAQIESIEKASEGLEMFANVGNSSRERPNKAQFDRRGESIFWGGKGVFLSREEVGAGDWIKLYLQLSPGMRVKLFSSVLNGNSFLVELGKSYFDFTSYSQSKVYKLDLGSEASAIAGRTVSIGLVVYSGSPYVDIAMDSSFLNSFSERSSVAATTFQITQAMRRQENFTGAIFIRVTSYWTADYLLYSQLQADSYTSLQPDIDVYNELQPGQLYNYFFDDTAYTGQNTLRNYSLRVDVITGKLKFGIRRCRPAESSESVLDCVIGDLAELQEGAVLGSFQEIELTLKKSDLYYYLVFQVEASQCSALNGSLAHYCSFHVVAIEDANLTAHYTLALSKRQYHATLREGQLARDVVLRQEYLFYRFLLPALDGVDSLTFYSTVIEGDLYLIASTVEEFPTLESEGKNLFFSVGNFLTFRSSELAHTIYVAVYGIQLSEFSLGVKVVRSDNRTSNTTARNRSETELAISMDLSQEYTLKEGESTATFLVSTDQSSNITLQVMMLAGAVTLELRDSAKKTVECSNQSLSNNKATCSWGTIGGQTYRAVVRGKAEEVQKFVILFRRQSACLAYSLNLPLYLELQRGEQGCVVYSLAKAVELEVTSSVPLSRLLDQSLTMTVCLNEHCLQPAASHHQAVTKQELSSFCSFRKGSSNVACEVKILFACSSAVSFSVIAEEGGRDVGLFDGIVERVSSPDLSHQRGRYFYYQVYDDSAIKLFFTSLSSSAYYLALHFVEEAEFLGNASALYLPYRETNYDTQQDFQLNFFEAIVYGTYTNIFTISSDTIDQYCDECVLAISVFPWYQEAHSLSSFEIEVSQTETLLFLGDSKVGYLESDEIYNYQLESSADSDALVSIRDLGRESNSQEDCFAASLSSESSDAPERLSNGLALIKRGSSLDNLYVEGAQGLCSYEVTYTRVDFPLVVAAEGKKYAFERQSAGRMYLLYTHTRNSSFRIVQIVNTGTLSLFAAPAANATLAQLLASDPAGFPFAGKDGGEFVVESSAEGFCWNCQYVVAVVSAEAAIAEVIVAGEGSSVPLSVNGIVKEKLGAGAVRNYTFNSISAFNISFSPIYGRLGVEVRDPGRKVVVNATISSAQTFLVPHNNQTEAFSNDYNSYFTRYQIAVTALAQSSYAIKVSRQAVTSRIFEGVPFYYDFAPNQTARLEFLNLASPDHRSNSLDLLVGLADPAPDAPALTASAAFESTEGGEAVDLPISSLRLSDNAVFSLELPLKRGTYYISLAFDRAVSSSITLVKQSLVHLAPSASAVLFRAGLFELYSASKAAMIEVFTCYGDLRVAASRNYNNLSGSSARLNEVVLEQSNYGGHFVINAGQVFGEYFVRVEPRREAELGYLIKYHYYEPNDPPPYKLIDLAERDITYAFTGTAVLFRFRPVAVDWQQTQSIEAVLVQYRLFLADSKTKVAQFANCRLGSVFTATAALADISEEAVEVAVELGEIGRIAGQEQVYFVGAEAEVQIEASAGSEEYPDRLRLIYETIELSNIRSGSQAQPATSYSPQVVVLWFLLPFAIAGAALYLALKFCIKKYRGLLPNELIEEGDNGGSEQAVQSRSPFDGKANASQQLKDEV